MLRRRIITILIVIASMTLLSIIKQINTQKQDDIDNIYYDKYEVISIYIKNKNYFAEIVEDINELKGYIYIRKSNGEVLINDEKSESVDENIIYIMDELKFLTVTKFDNGDMQFIIRDDFMYHGLIFIKSETKPKNNGGESYEQIDDHWYYIEKYYT